MTYDNAIGPMGQAFLDSQDRREAFEDLSAAEINSMSFIEFARRTGRPTPVRAAISALYGTEKDLQSAPQPSNPSQTGDSTPTTANAPQVASEPAQGKAIAEMDMDEYAALRSQLGLGQGREYGRGITNAPSQSWAEAAAAKSGRSAMVERGVQAPSGIPRVFINENAQPVQGRKSYYR